MMTQSVANEHTILRDLCNGLILRRATAADADALATSVNAGGYLAESYRSGFEAVPRGQREAAAALGMSDLVAFWRVRLPLALRVILPAIGNLLLAMLLGTPFVFLVSLLDMMTAAELIISRTADFTVCLFVTIIYSAIGLVIVWVNSRLERRLRLPVRSVEG